MRRNTYFTTEAAPLYGSLLLHGLAQINTLEKL